MLVYGVCVSTGGGALLGDKYLFGGLAVSLHQPKICPNIEMYYF